MIAPTDRQLKYIKFIEDMLFYSYHSYSPVWSPDYRDEWLLEKELKFTGTEIAQAHDYISRHKDQAQATRDILHGASQRAAGRNFLGRMVLGSGILDNLDGYPSINCKDDM